MFHFRKDFSNLTRDYRAQDEAGLPEITPVVIADDTSEYVTRTRPIYGVLLTQAAVAAVFGSCSLFVGTNPIRLVGASTFNTAASNVRLFLGIVDVRDANQASVVPVGLARGLAAATAGGRTGTTITAVPAASAQWVEYTYQNNDEHHPTGLIGQTFRPGEYITAISDAANIATSFQFQWEELQYGLPGNPPDLG